jgi:hypothetical protein
MNSRREGERKPPGIVLPRKLNPQLKPIRAVHPDPNLSKQSFSEQGSLVDDEEEDCLDDLEVLLSQTLSKVNLFSNELKELNSRIPSADDKQAKSTDKSGLEGLLKATGISPLARSNSKGSFAIRPVKRSVSKNNNGDKKK